ncbi:hypothetical protein J437_LFUL013020 [Ladona fulva]|uniref:RING-CH-type domain-containing protein n=1 Tax=Ladona fulva TaxID=123851 RepID=A0A8K0KM70_LADFU|nr:hypothetical protein J437_LFUL013020 [Ladona fulva]
MRHVHEACLQQWIKSSDIRSCELCKFQFVMQSKIKPFAEWEKLDMSPVERRKLACSVTFYGVALACVGWSLYVLIDRIAEEAQRDFLKWPFWTKLVVVAVGFTGGLFFMHVQCKAYLGLLRRWRAFNRIICVQNAPERPMLSSTATARTSLKVDTLPEVHHARSPLLEEGRESAGKAMEEGPISEEVVVVEEGVRWKAEGEEADELSGLLSEVKSTLQENADKGMQDQVPQILVVGVSGGGERSSLSLSSCSPLLPWDRSGPHEN